MTRGLADDGKALPVGSRYGDAMGATEEPPYPRPDDEDIRLEQLRDYAILDSAPDLAYADLVHLASFICGTPIAAVSLVDEDRQWFKATKGLDTDETAREHAFCAHAIVDPGEVLVVEDATQDPRFADNPHVKGEPNIRFYAGAPLMTADGHGLGTICVMDDEPRELDEDQRRALEALSRQVMIHLELRRTAEDFRRTQNELRSRNTELERKNEELERFADVLSHDLRSPLSTVLGNLDAVRDRISGEELEAVEDAIHGAEQVEAMIDGLRRYVHLEQPSEFEPVDLDEVVDDAISNVKQEIEESGAEIERPDLPVLEGDRPRLVQLFQNLIHNAIRFRSDDPPRIRIRMSETDDGWRIEVEDNGVGIDEDEHAEIFEIFRRSRHVEHIEGTGIGLATCRNIVQQHGGEIGVDSTPGSGSTFWFTLPAA